MKHLSVIANLCNRKTTVKLHTCHTLNRYHHKLMHGLVSLAHNNRALRTIGRQNRKKHAWKAILDWYLWPR